MPALAGRELVVLGEGRTVTVAEDGNLSARFEPYATHLFVTDPAFATFERIADVQATIDAANAARKQPGNLAFEDSGVMLRVSSQGKYQSSPVWMVDGIRAGKGWKALPFTGNDWVELTWPRPQSIGRLAIHTDALADIEIQVAEGDDAKPVWRRVAAVKDAASDPVEVTFEPVETHRLRVAISRLRTGVAASRIWEIEAYGQ